MLAITTKSPYAVRALAELARRGGDSPVPWPIRFAAPLALMAVIFVLSNQPDLNSGLGVIDLIGRKLIHAGEYALLCFLWWWALSPGMARRPALIAAVAVSIAYAASDEYHQTFIDGRHGSPLDVAIDSAGVLIAALALARREER